jgi:hypothetical protein
MAEFIGTFFLVFTVGCNVAAVGAGGSQGIFVAISIGSVLMITIYALGLSAAHILSFRAIILQSGEFSNFSAYSGYAAKLYSFVNTE